MGDDVVLIDVFAGLASDGEPILEELPARRVGVDKFEILSSPGLALNIAKGDVIDDRPATKPVTVVKRGGNVCVQVYFHEEHDWIDLEIKNLDGIAASLGGTLDGLMSDNLSFTLPAIAGFGAIEERMNSLESKYHCEWHYGNVYGEDGVTPLNWWREFNVTSNPTRTAHAQ